MMAEDDEIIALSADTLQILNEFLQEKAQREELEKKAGKEAKFEENWQLSQFWYSQSTKDDLARVVQKLLQTDSQQPAETLRIALLSCPSLYGTIKELHANVRIFEYDKRFEAFGADFVFYDFNEATSPDYLKDYAESFDIFIVDPPFLSSECVTKMSHIIRQLQKPTAKLIFCSGAVVAPWLLSCLPSLHKCSYAPQHERNLGNEFAAFANFNLDELV